MLVHYFFERPKTQHLSRTYFFSHVSRFHAIIFRRSCLPTYVQTYTSFLNSRAKRTNNGHQVRDGGVGEKSGNHNEKKSTMSKRKYLDAIGSRKGGHGPTSSSYSSSSSSSSISISSPTQKDQGRIDPQDISVILSLCQTEGLLANENSSEQQDEEPYVSFENGRVVHLRLKHCELQNLPCDLGKLTNLRILNLAASRSLVGLPNTIGGLQNLHSLILRGCISLTSLPSEIGELQNLHTLNFWGCRSLTCLPPEVFQLQSLEILDLADCTSMENLSSDIVKLTNLRSLDLICCTAMTALPLEILGLDQLEELDMRRCDNMIFPPAKYVSNLAGAMCFLAAYRNMLERDASVIRIMEKRSPPKNGGKPSLYWLAFEAFCKNRTNASRLKDAVQQNPALLVWEENTLGLLPSDNACDECIEAMKDGLIGAVRWYLESKQVILKRRRWKR